MAHISRGQELYSESFTPSERQCQLVKTPVAPKYENVRILMADDDEFIRTAHVRQLGKFTKNIAVCGDGTEALAIYKKNIGEFHLAIIDGRMPQMDGVTTIRNIRELEITSKIKQKLKIICIKYSLITKFSFVRR